MKLLIGLIITVCLFVIELLYFKIAIYFKIIDQPNNRSSHVKTTIRGGGINFPIACLLHVVFFGLYYPWFLMGLLLISAISFIDDMVTLNSKVRMLFQFAAIILLTVDLNLFSLIPVYMLVPVMVFAMATINAYNFMDGINGITGSYSLLVIISLYYINANMVSFVDPSFLIVIGIALFVFNFFNFRIRAKCFAGDVGSVSIAFIIIFLIGQLVLKTSNPCYILLLLIYGLDAVTTIIFRVFRKENILEPHRSHFYQYLANEKKWAHLWVSTLYFGLQLAINLVLIFYVQSSLFLAITFSLLIATAFIGIRFWLEGSKRLLKAL